MLNSGNKNKKTPSGIFTTTRRRVKYGNKRKEKQRNKAKRWEPNNGKDEKERRADESRSQTLCRRTDEFIKRTTYDVGSARVQDADTGGAEPPANQ